MNQSAQIINSYLEYLISEKFVHTRQKIEINSILTTDITNGFIVIPLSGIWLRDSREILPQI